MLMGRLMAAGIVLVLSWAACDAARAEDGYEAWLRYRPLPEAPAARPVAIVQTRRSPLLDSAAAELRRGLGVMLQQEVTLNQGPPAPGAIVLVDQPDQAPAVIVAALREADLPGLGEEGFVLRSVPVEGGSCLAIAANSDRGVLYGAFALLRQVQLGQPLDEIDLHQRPAIPLRMINQWDNLDGTVERGYAGPSIYRWETLSQPDPRYTDYARLLASIGLNAVCINNVNAGFKNNAQILTADYLPKVAALAAVFRRYGVRLYLAVGFDSPRTLGKLPTADPLDPRVRQWWADKADEIYALIPDFGGFVIKADSEGQAGPYRYGRNHADGADMLAEALRPHGGQLIWRAFVYNLRAGDDRAAMAYQHFNPLDGRFADNALVQVKHGPLDFQVREPVHPLLGAMPQTRQVLELQITQEYTGHDVHVCYQVPAWKEVLDFDTHLNGEGSTVARRLGGSLLPHAGGIAGVLNIGQARNWLGHHLHLANFYGFGRLAWAPDLPDGQIAAEWAALTFGRDEQVVRTIAAILMDSQRAYESYTSPLGLGVLHDGPRHFDPAPEIRHYYHRANDRTVGFDRTRATGSGYTAQYAPPVARQFEGIDRCPVDLLLFFHAVPYTHRLADGQTLIQTLYNRYFDGVELAQDMRRRWISLAGRIDEARHRAVLERFDRQIDHALIWRAQMTRFFFELSGVPDEHKRVRSDYRLRPAERK